MSLHLIALTTLMLSAPVSDPTSLALNGSWRAEPEETRLTSAFDESVWGKDAKSIRTVEMIVRSGSEASLTITRKVLDARGRTVPGSTSIERVTLSIGNVESTMGVRAEHAVTVTNAERHYPDDPEGKWMIEGLKVSVTTFTDDPAMLEVRVDFPEGRGSFWTALHRSGARKPMKTSS
jgi:hypothetical protein